MSVKLMLNMKLNYVVKYFKKETLICLTKIMNFAKSRFQKIERIFPVPINIIVIYAFIFYIYRIQGQITKIKILIVFNLSDFDVETIRIVCEFA
jgi:hypothetical protein